MRGDIGQVFISRERIRSRAKFYYNEDEGKYIMEVMDIETSIKMEYRDPLAYQDQKEYFDNVLIDKFINNSEDFKRFLVLENRLEKLEELGI